MADEQVAVEFERLRGVKGKRHAELAKTQSILEQDPNKIHTLTLTVGQTQHKLRFRIWTHAQANMLYGLPFIDKIIANTSKEKDKQVKLTPQEEPIWVAMQIEMVLIALVDREKWEPMLTENLKLLNVVWNVISSFSGWGMEFDDRLTEFFDDDWGMNYGYFWFVVQKRSPSEIGKLSDLEVKAMNLWVNKWASKLENK